MTVEPQPGDLVAGYDESGNLVFDEVVIGEDGLVQFRRLDEKATAFQNGWDAGIEAAAKVCGDEDAAEAIRALAKPALWPEHIATPTDQPLNQE